MQEITNHFSTADYAELVDEISQNCNQYDNRAIQLHRINSDNAQYANEPGVPAGAIVLIEQDYADSHYYLLDADEAAQAIADPADYLRDCAGDWADNSDADRVLEQLRWGLGSLGDLKVADDYAGEVAIIREGSWYGYTPLDWVTEDQPGVWEPRIFTSRADAQAWIDETQTGTYYLSHNEAGRPSYYIVEA